MDTSGFCQVGRHGTLSLLKGQNVPVGEAGDGILTSFGIDDDELTFGSSPACSVRLYYSDVDSLHCKIVFDQFKAFLTILGASGVFVDGCRVFPHTSGETSGSMGQTIIPLTNNSIFEIHGKRFKFNYPPKELRKALYATPARPPQRALRLSMIHSAQVFSPRPSNDPRENLRILQSPMKRPSSPIKNSSPLKSAILPDIDEEEEIVLVQTDHPRVVEEEKDLVILEAVPVQLLSPIKSTLQQSNQFPVIQVQQQPPCTPRRRSLGGTALHRAVLIRSAQRAVQKAEKEMEEVEEELEVLGTVVSNNDGDDERTMKNETADMGDVEMFDVDDEDEETDSEDEDSEPDEQTLKSLWKKSLEKIIPWSLNGSAIETEGKGPQGDGPTNETAYQEEEPGPLTPIKPSRKVLGNFMTPQPRHHPRTRIMNSKEDVPGARAMAHGSRFSLGGPARRIIVEEPWKVHDLVVPPTTPSKGDSHPLMPIDPPAPGTLSFEGPLVVTPWKSGPSRATTPANGNSITAITDDEKKAIQERRRSAVKEFGSTPFWAGGAPGMSPVKGGLDHSNTLTPNKPTGVVSPSKRFIHGSPMQPIKERGDSNAHRSQSDEDLDASGLLDKIKETVNDMKRRRSVILGGNVMGTQPPTSGSEDLSTHAANPIVSAISGESPMKVVDFTKMAPSKTSTWHHPIRKTSPQKTFANNEEITANTHQEEPFSLLRPGALEGRRQSLVSTPLRKEQVVTVVPVPLIAVEHTPTNGLEELPQETVTRGRTRALRSGSNITESYPDVGTEVDSGDTKLKTTNAKPPSARRQRSKISQSQALEDAACNMSSVDVSQQASRSAASGKVTTVESTADHIPEEIDNVENPATRIRKAPTVAKGEDEAKPTQVVPKRGRPRKNAAPAEKSQDTRLAGKPTSKVRSSSRKKTPTNIRETDSEDDPLDSYEIGAPPSSSTEEDRDLPLDSSTTLDAQSKTKTPVAVTKGRAATRVKQEEPLENSTLPVPTTRVRRSAKANTDSQKPDVTPAVKAATGKTRGRPKTPATAPANTGASIAEEKENTTRLRSKLKSAEKVPNPEAEELPVKMRVSRSRAAAKAAEEDDDQPPTRQRTTRIMRTRTKTG